MPSSTWLREWAGWPEIGQPIVLESEKLAALILPQVGGSVAGLLYFDDNDRAKGRPVLRPGSPPDVLRHGARGASQFTMVPFANRAFGNALGSGAARYAVVPNTQEPSALHGVGWQLPWEVAAQGEGFCELVLDVREGMFAFPFSATQRIGIIENRFEIILCVRNSGPHPVPMGGGFHPYFLLGPRTRALHGSAGSTIVHPNAPPVGYKPGEPDSTVIPLEPGQRSLCYLGWSGRTVIEQPDLGHVVTMFGSAKLVNLTAYVPKARNCFALEPQSHTSGVTGLDACEPQFTPLSLIAPGEPFEVSMSIVVRGTQNQCNGEGAPA